MQINVTSTMIGDKKRFMAQLYLHGYWHAAFFGKTSTDAFGKALAYVRDNCCTCDIARIPERTVN